MENAFTSRKGIMSLAVIVLVIYYPVLFAPLNSVDDPGMYSSLLNANSLTLHSIFFPGGSGSYYRPILFLSFMMDKFVWGLEESFMHLENILFHLTNTFLVFAVARRATDTFSETSPVMPFVAALFFAIHPLNTEAVNWISGRTDLLAGFFLLLAMYLILKKPLTWLQSMVAAFCMLLACLAKETAIFFLPASLLFPFFMSAVRTDAAPLNSVFRRYWFHLFFFSSAGASYFVFRALAFSKGDQGVARVLTHVGGTESTGMLINARIVLKAVGFYAKKLFIPFPLNFGITHVSDWYLPLGILVLIWIIWLLTRRTLTAFFVICAGAVGTSALMIPLLRFTWTPLGERYMYIPSAFFLVGVAMAVQHWKQCTKYRVPLTVAVSCLIAIAFYGTATRNILWQDNLALFQDTLRKSPDFIPAQNEIANALHNKGKQKEAADIYKSFNETNGLINAQYGLKNKAFALMNEGDFSGARDILKQLLANPGKHEVSILLQVLELNKIQVSAKKATINDVYPESVKTLSRLVELTSDPFYSYRLGIVHMQVGEKEKALTAFNTVVRTAPPTAYYRAPAEKLANDLRK
jgi:predicted negative regulator of RcsB-dependent stress response